MRGSWPSLITPKIAAVVMRRTAEDDERAKAEAALEALKLKAEAARLIEHNPDLAASEEPAEDYDGWKPPTYG